MNRLIATAFVFGIMVGAANAMPMTPLAPAANRDVIEVAGGCGRGWHRGPYGGCRRNYVNPAAHAAALPPSQPPEEARPWRPAQPHTIRNPTGSASPR